MTGADPRTLPAFDLLWKMTDIVDRVQTTFVLHDTKLTDAKAKDSDNEVVGVPLPLFNYLALYSPIAKAGAVQDDCTAEPNYSAAYFATDIDRCIAGLRSDYVPAARLLVLRFSPVLVLLSILLTQIFEPFFAPCGHYQPVLFPRLNSFCLR